MELGKVLLHTGPALVNSGKGAIPGALRDIEAADQVTEDLLRPLGIPAGEARDLARRPLPDPADLLPHPVA